MQRRVGTFGRVWSADVARRVALRSDILDMIAMILGGRISLISPSPPLGCRLAARAISRGDGDVPVCCMGGIGGGSERISIHHLAASIGLGLGRIVNDDNFLRQTIGIKSVPIWTTGPTPLPGWLWNVGHGRQRLRLVVRVITAAGAVTASLINIRIVLSVCTRRICPLLRVVVGQMAVWRGSRWCSAREVVYAIRRRAVARVCRLLLGLVVVVTLLVILVV